MRHRMFTVVVASALLLAGTGVSMAKDDKPATPTSDKPRPARSTSPSIDRLVPARPTPPKPNEVKLPTTPPPRVAPKPPLGADINTTDRTVTVPVTRDGNTRFGVQGTSKDPTRDNPRGETSGAAIFQQRIP